MAKKIKKYEFIDHTGDLGIRVFGDTRGALFAYAAEALFEILTDPGKIRKKASREISLEAQDSEELMVTWLNEFIYLFDAEQLLFKECEIHSVDETRIHASAIGESYQQERHPIKTTIKGATYHQIRVYHEGGIWKAQVIFDL